MWESRRCLEIFHYVSCRDAGERAQNKLRVKHVAEPNQYGEVGGAAQSLAVLRDIANWTIS